MENRQKDQPGTNALFLKYNNVAPFKGGESACPLVNNG
jgi:hypothetical protein